MVAAGLAADGILDLGVLLRARRLLQQIGQHVRHAIHRQCLQLAQPVKKQRSRHTDSDKSRSRFETARITPSWSIAEVTARQKLWIVGSSFDNCSRNTLRLHDLRIGNSSKGVLPLSSEVVLWDPLILDSAWCRDIATFRDALHGHLRHSEPTLFWVAAPVRPSLRSAPHQILWGFVIQATVESEVVR